MKTLEPALESELLRPGRSEKPTVTQSAEHSHSHLHSVAVASAAEKDSSKE